MAQATPTPKGIDIDIDDAALALHTPRLSRTQECCVGAVDESPP